MRHYPTSAELAAFRDAGSPYVLHPVAGAYSDERTIGIGYRAAEGYAPEYVTPDPGQPWDGYHVTMSANDADRVYAIRARREASRMRSRAFASVITEGQRAVYHGGSARNACLRERSEGLPVPIDHYHVSGAPLV